MELSGSGRQRAVLSVASVDLPPGAAAESYSLPNIQDREGLLAALRQNLSDRRIGNGRAALCLPDALFRIQTLDFDELPTRTSDHERLIRWRLEKAAAFDLADTVLRYQVLRRQKGVTVLACVSKKALIGQYEDVLAGLGLETWTIIPSSFAVVKLYSPRLAQHSLSYALTHMTGDSFATIVVEKGGIGFYRFKDIKRGSAADVPARLARDITDSLHFYTHRDRTQQAALTHLYLSGDRELCNALQHELGTEAPLQVEVLSPAEVISASGQAAGPELAAALGAGMAL